MKTKRLSITVPVTTREAIHSLAIRMGVSDSSAAQHLLKIGLTAESIAFGGGEIVARINGGEERILADRDGNFTHRLPMLESGGEPVEH